MMNLIRATVHRLEGSRAGNEETFERGVASTMESLEGLYVDVPTAHAVMVHLRVAANLSYGAFGRLVDSTACEEHPLVPFLKIYGGREDIEGACYVAEHD